MKKGILKIGTIFLLMISLILIVATISYAEKISANSGRLIHLNNLANFIQERTSSVLKADVRDSQGRVFLLVKSQNQDNDKVVLRMDLREPAVNYYAYEMTGYARINYKITNNGIFVIDPVSDSRGFFHKRRIGQKPTIQETKLENVTITFNNSLISIKSASFEVKDLLLN